MTREPGRQRDRAMEDVGQKTRDRNADTDMPWRLDNWTTWTTWTIGQLRHDTVSLSLCAVLLFLLFLLFPFSLLLLLLLLSVALAKCS